MQNHTLSEYGAVIALGANLRRPQQQIRDAVAALRAQPSVRVEHVSSLYRTSPVGYADQPDFVNAVMLVQTVLTPEKLLRLLQETENRFGRERSFRNAPRTLDLDLIDYDGRILDSDDLVLPHPRAHERAFVMVPLAEIAPDYRIAGRCAEDWAQLLLRDKPHETVYAISENRQPENQNIHTEQLSGN